MVSSRNQGISQHRRHLRQQLLGLIDGGTGGRVIGAERRGAQLLQVLLQRVARLPHVQLHARDEQQRARSMASAESGARRKKLE
jgi:hypothetical protein